MAARRPHIILIVADDYPWELWPRASGHPHTSLQLRLYHTFVDGGLSLERHYATPMCAPSRASLMTGRWPHRAYPLEGGMRSCKGLSPGITSLSEKLAGSGYTAHFIGK